MIPPLDTLTNNPTGSQRSTPEATAYTPGPESMGFDVFHIKSFTNKTKVVGNFAIYGPVEILHVDPGNVSAIVTGIAVEMDPDAHCFRWGWWLLVNRGAVQEYSIDSHLSFDGDPCKQWAGRIWAPFASLDAPQKLRIAVDPGAELQIASSVELPIVTAALNLNVRLIGYYQTKKR